MTNTDTTLTSVEVLPPQGERLQKVVIPQGEPVLAARLLPCPCCGVLQIGYPLPSPGGGGQYTSYAGLSAWKYRLDLIGWVCPTCHQELGPDLVREAAIAQCTPHP